MPLLFLEIFDPENESAISKRCLNFEGRFHNKLDLQYEKRETRKLDLQHLN